MRSFAFDFDARFFEKASPDGNDRRIGGMVSTDHMDRQSEVLIQDGLDFGPFLKGGWFNDNHDQSTDAVLGYPTSAVLQPLPDGRKGWYVEGYLLKGTERADKIWELAKALQKSERSLGFSVEGSIEARDADNPKIVRKAIVREVAITRCPVNTQATLSLLVKSLSAGSAVSDPGTAPGEGFPLRVQSLEGRKSKRKRIKKSEAVDLLQRLRPGISREFATGIVEYAMRFHASKGSDEHE